MTALILPNRYANRELLYPGRKPVGNVEIDWSHPLAKGLKHFYLLGPNGTTDLVTRGVGTNNGVSYKGDIADFDGASDYISVPSEALFLPDGAFTLAWRSDLDSIINSYNGLFTPAKDSAGTDNCNLFASSNNQWYPFSFRHVNPTYGIKTTRWNPNTFGTSALGDHFWAIKWDGTSQANDTYRLFKDDLDAAHYNNGGSLSVNETSIGRYNATHEIDGRLYYLAVWGRELSNADLFEYRHGPYQILIKP
jgi:hypothetical protein